MQISKRSCTEINRRQPKCGVQWSVQLRVDGEVKQEARPRDRMRISWGPWRAVTIRWCLYTACHGSQRDSVTRARLLLHLAIHV
eukprot:6172886-Pleurochrysis_carterae.AAC.1